MARRKIELCIAIATSVWDTKPQCPKVTVMTYDMEPRLRRGVDVYAELFPPALPRNEASTAKAHEDHSVSIVATAR